jgi:hypothetical protein
MPEPGRHAYLSKSLFMQGLQCPKSLYLNRHHPELRSEPTPELLALWKSGHEVGLVAQRLFPGGVNVPFDGLSKEEQLAKTRAEILGGASVIYEATFSHDGVFVKADILCRTRGSWDLYEVKAAAEVKDHFPDDVAIQYYVLSGSGIPVRKACLVHVNSGYVRRSEIVPEELFTACDITDLVRQRQAMIPSELSSLRKMLSGKTPDTDIGPHCDDPYVCDFRDHCWKHVPEDSVFSLRGRGIDKWELYRRGIIRLADVPSGLLNNPQGMQVEYFLGRKHHVQREGIREFLARLWYPVCVLDFETFGSAIPPFDGTQPYQQIPFLYSLHRLEKPGAAPRHFDFLAAPGVDPRREMVGKLLGEIPQDACVLVYNMAFEKRILRELAEYLPEHRKRLLAVTDNMVDMMEPFRRRDVYHWEMAGSYSLKTVLPVLIPDLSYDGMEVCDGRMASEAFLSMRGISDEAERARLGKALRKYCRMDTLGVVKLLEKLQDMAR